MCSQLLFRGQTLPLQIEEQEHLHQPFIVRRHNRTSLENSNPFWGFNRKETQMPYSELELPSEVWAHTNTNYWLKSILIWKWIRKVNYVPNAASLHQGETLSGTKRLAEWEIFKKTRNEYTFGCVSSQAALTPYRNAREKMAVKEPLDKEGLDLAKPLVSKIWN